MPSAPSMSSTVASFKSRSKPEPKMKASRFQATTLALLLVVIAPAAPRHVTLLREAATAAKTGDQVAALAKLEEAARLRPDYPRIQINLARTYAALNRPADALVTLKRIAAMGLQVNLAADPALATLKDSPEFHSVASQLANGPLAVGAANETTFTLSGVTGIIESCLVDPVTGIWYFGDGRHRCICRQIEDGSLVKFSSDADHLDGVFKLALSADRKTLWATTATIGVMTGPEAEDGKRSALIAIDFATGRVRDRFPVPAVERKQLLGDFVIAADGSIYATDSFSPVIWRLPAGGTALEPWLESDEFLNLQGLAFSANQRTLFVADYANGIWRIDVATKSPALLTAPTNATFFGIDGLYAFPGGLLAVQNGINPQRVLRIEPAASEASAARIVALGLPAMTDLALGQVIDGHFHFVGNSGWALFDPPPANPPPARPVTIYSVPIE